MTTNLLLRSSWAVVLLGSLSICSGAWWSIGASNSVLLYQAAMLTGILGIFAFLIYAWRATRVTYGSRFAALLIIGFLCSLTGPCLAYRTAWSEFSVSQAGQTSSYNFKKFEAVSSDVAIIAVLAQQYRLRTGKWPVPGQQTGDVVVNGNAQSHVWVEIAHQLAIDGKAESLFLGVQKLQEDLFLDPWGIPYSIVFDVDNDGYCTISDEIRVASRSGIFVWSTGLWQTISQ